MTKGFYPAIRRDAQQLYNWREQTQEISGNDLAQLFQELIDNPSPAGRTPIDIARLERIAAENTGARAGAAHSERAGCEAHRGYVIVLAPPRRRT